MINFLVGLAWQALVLWAAIQVCFSMQVIDTATVFVNQAELCELFEEPVTNGGCRVTGRLEGTIRSTWTLSPAPDHSFEIELPDRSLGMIYNPQDWHMVGGATAVTGLVALTLTLSGLGIWGGFVATKRRIRRRSQAQGG
ncbi:hypothetical protein DENIT_20115 [Pseudomonas veronii]|uniref:hypothetical protein n=1 Tax=Pseudomonas veronii TaxID=76761 RepID=UPI001774A96F|nr:hypothetical protein [Pseudomonas veronii]CAD0264226.1 hypothetical protein DENIT_20115 [Pseudomonas veronii]